LQIQDQFLVELGGNFGDAIGPGPVIRRSQPGFPAVILDDANDRFAVGCDYDAVKFRASPSAVEHSNNHGHARDELKRLPRQSHGLHTSRDDSRYSHPTP
jgi:hypothetical protein